MSYLNNMSVRTCDQCRANNRRGTRCRLRTCTTGPYCWIHTKNLEGVRVKRSKIAGAGLGLYTLRARAPNSQVGEYTGELLDKRQLDALYPGDTLAPYALQLDPYRPNPLSKKLTKKKWVDARKTNSGNMRYINTCDAPAGQRRMCRNNVYFHQEGPKLVVKVCPGRIIKKNAELYVSYERDYQIGGQDVVPRECD